MVVGAGQSPGETMGNGRATSLLFAREGAMVVAVDRDLVSAEETVAMIHGEGGQAMAIEAGDPDNPDFTLDRLIDGTPTLIPLPDPFTMEYPSAR